MDRSVAVDRLFRATVNSWHGLRVAARSEAAVREELVMLVLAAPLAVLVAEGASSLSHSITWRFSMAAGSTGTSSSRRSRSARSRRDAGKDGAAC
jgi:hypothetical protein